MKKPVEKPVFENSEVRCDVVRDEGLTACRSSFAGFFFGFPVGRLQTVTGSNVRRTFELSGKR